jgi:hypothetical protein
MMIFWTIIIDIFFIDLRVDWSSTSLTNAVWASLTSIFCVELISDFIDFSSSTIDQSSSKISLFLRFRSFEFVEDCVNLEFFFQIETICDDVFYFIAFITDEMRMIRAFSLLFVDVFSTILRLYFVVKRIFIFSFFISVSFFIERCSEVERTIIKRRLSVLSFSYCSSDDLLKSTIFFEWWVDSDNSLTQRAASIWAWWINELCVVSRCTKSSDSWDYLKKRQKLTSIVFLFALRSKKTAHDENDD